jgi:hypothetical protein
MTWENGVCNITISSALAQLVSRNVLRRLFKFIGDENSEIQFEIQFKLNAKENA